MLKFLDELKEFFHKKEQSLEKKETDQAKKTEAPQQPQAASQDGEPIAPDEVEYQKILALRHEQRALAEEAGAVLLGAILGEPAKTTKKKNNGQQDKARGQEQ